MGTVQCLIWGKGISCKIAWVITCIGSHHWRYGNKHISRASREKNIYPSHHNNDSTHFAKCGYMITCCHYIILHVHVSIHAVIIMKTMITPHWTCLKRYSMKLLKTCIPTADNHHPLLNNEWSFMGALITLAFLSQASIFNHNQLILPVQLFRKTTGTFQFVSKCYFWGVNVSGICIIIHLLHFTFLPNDFNLH